MKDIAQTYTYAKQNGGVGRFGQVKLQIGKNNSGNNFIDQCKEYVQPNYKSWVFDTVIQLLELNSISNVDITLHDLAIHVLSTRPSHIGAATLIGFYDQINKPLSTKELEKLNQFVIKNNSVEELPNFKNWL